MPQLTAGQWDVPMFPRSSNKPMQAAGMLRCGLDLDGKLLALAAASHSGEDFHVAGVREILARAGLTEDELQCPRALPREEVFQQEFLREGGEPDRVHMNCSGKHAAMLATCVAAGWPTATYTRPRRTRSRWRSARPSRAWPGSSPRRWAWTGAVPPCSPCPWLAWPGRSRRWSPARPGTPERRVADAMRAYPEWTSGSLRTERALMATVPGLLLKVGADGVQAFALADGRAAAFKIEDGSARARDPITVALLRRLGVTTGPGMPDSALDEIGAVPVIGGGRVVGVIRAELPG